MLVAPARVPATRRLAATLYGYAFLTDLVLLYPLYVLLFADTGLSVGQISSLFVLWAAAGIVLEVPSGVWADAVSRRLLLCLAPLLAAGGFALWVLLPSYPAFAVGFLLWGAGGALRSGALEALVFTELERLGATGRYARLIGRTRTAEVLGAVGSGVLAGPVFALGGYLAVGAASVATCLLAAAVAARFPEHRRPPAALPAVPAGPIPSAVPAGPIPSAVPAGPVPTTGPDGLPVLPRVPAAAQVSPDHPTPGAGDEAGEWPGDEEPGWLDSLRLGLCEVRADRRVRAAVLLVAAVTAIWGGLDEYTGLLAADTGMAEVGVPLLLLLVWAGMTVGGLLAPLGERLSHRGYAGLLVFAAAATAAGALLRHPAGFLLLAAAFAAFQLATVLADVRLQARIAGPARATVTSLAGMATDLTIVAFYGGYGLLAGAVGNPAAFAVAVLPYLLVALWLATGRALIGGKGTNGRVRG
ncbi:MULTISPECIES: MFS transporter [unclassified Micromonospora]|uniref:MFS transporter n=1 Tax=unclassified Micromonospora TaxID=2617518 RepID=UPI001C237ADC|nr:MULTISPECIES: MFS transporter [unclassified Micromonospora]MBU8861055.1 MFS transporter [Micromonospora sp. WMMB482]MDM4780599.1 MFS transporter [Micromonospora sp. b486]